MLIGIGFGIIFGIFPGLSVLFAVISAMPFLFLFSAFQIILFYVALQISINYCGSIPATFFGIPGEPNSVPASKTAYSFYKRGFGEKALSMAASGSTVAVFLTVTLIYIFFPFLKEQNWIYSVKINFVINLLIIFYLIFINKNLSANLLLILLGLFLGNIGAKSMHYNSITIGQTWLESGIHMQLLILFAFVVPNLFKNLYNKVKIPKKTEDKEIKCFKRKYLLLKYKAACMRGSLIGILTGIIPAVGTAISSQLSYAIEKKISSKTGNHLVSAESANNSAGIACIIPILMLGMPILASEILILQLIEGKGITVGFNYFNTKESVFTRLEYLCIFAIFVSLIMYVFSTKFAHAIAKILFHVPHWLLIYVLPAVLTTVFLFDSFKHGAITASIFTILISIPIALYSIKKKIDTMPLVFSFLIGKNLIESSFMVFGLILTTI